MGTAAVVGFKLDEKYYLSLKNFDGHPFIAGVEVAELIHGAVSGGFLNGLRELVRKIRLVDPMSQPTKEDKALMISHGIYCAKVATGSPDDWYCLGYYLQGRLQLSLAIGIMVDGAEFFENPGHCDWAYIIDLDSEMFEAYSMNGTGKSCVRCIPIDDGALIDEMYDLREEDR